MTPSTHCSPVTRWRDPRIIEAETTTVLVDAGDRISVNALGWLDIALR